MARAQIVGPRAAYALWWRTEDARAAVAPANRLAWQIAYDRGQQRARRQVYQEATR